MNAKTARAVYMISLMPMPEITKSQSKEPNYSMKMNSFPEASKLLFYIQKNAVDRVVHIIQQQSFCGCYLQGRTHQCSKG